MLVWRVPLSSLKCVLRILVSLLNFSGKETRELIKKPLISLLTMESRYELATFSLTESLKHRPACFLWGGQHV